MMYAPFITSNAQLDAITNLSDIFGQWIDTIVLPSPVLDPRVDPSTPPTLTPMMSCPPTSVPLLSLPAPTPSVYTTKAPYSQTVCTAPRAK